MTTEEFYRFIEHPHLIDREALEIISDELEKNRASHSLQLLYLKGLYNSSREEFEAALRKSSLYAGSRSLLFRFITDKTFEFTAPDKPAASHKPVEATGKIRERHEKIGGNISEALDHQLTIAGESEKDDLPMAAGLNLAKEYGPLSEEENSKFSVNYHVSKKNKPSTPTAKKEPKAEEKETIDIPDQSALLELDDNDTREKKNPKPAAQNEIFDISEYYSDKNFKEVDTAKQQVQLIDKFLEAKPRIVPTQNDSTPVPDVSVDSVKENEGFITDTLARIYIKQKLYNKAIIAYEKLSLKYPEKSTYFANQIQEIKKLSNYENE